MRHTFGANRAGIRRAVAGSVAVHILIAIIITGVSVFRAKRPLAGGSGVKLDTCVDKQFVQVFTEEPRTPVTTAEPVAEPIREPIKSQATAVADPLLPKAPEPTELASDSARSPHIQAMPQILPASMRDRIRSPRHAPNDSNIRPVKGVATTPLHGAMTEGHSVVYVLDCSGSMGAFGKLEAARSALIATLRRQSGGVRFQVIIYNSVTRMVLPGGCVAATPANIAAIEAGLANLTPSGKSNHSEAVRAAHALRPDVIVVLTDADELLSNRFKVPTGPPVCVAQVTADGVGQPRQIR